MSNLRTVLQDTDPVQTGAREEWASAYAGGHAKRTFPDPPYGAPLTKPEWPARPGPLVPGWQPVHDAPALLTDEQRAHIRWLTRRRRRWTAILLDALLWAAAWLLIAGGAAFVLRVWWEVIHA